jgi:hypothetical protein
MKLPDFTKHSWLNSLREKIGAELNFLYRPKNKPIWDLKVNNLLKSWELRNIYLSEIQVNSNNLLEYKKNKVLVYQDHQLERWVEWNQQFHFYNCATIKKWREDKKYVWKYVANKNAPFKINIESYWKILQKNVIVELRVCKNCLKESNYYNYEDVDYNMKNHIYKNFSKKEYFEAVD